MNYEFVEDIVKHYDNLRQSYEAETEMEIVKNLGWRDDFKFCLICAKLIGTINQ